MNQPALRTILPGDNARLASIVRDALTEFGANKPGTVFYDPTTDRLFELFQQQGAAYWVAEWEGILVGGAGIIPSPGLPPGTCELVKMYLKPSARGLGLGKLLLETCLDFAKSAGYSQVYIETMPELKNALNLYEKFGFHYLSGPLGQTGHFGCDVWMQKSI